MINYWLMKTEPQTFSIDTLKKISQSGWDGVRNYQARNFMRDQMKVNDMILFYHSSCEVPGIVGLAKVCKSAYPDPTQFDKKSKYFDPKSTLDNPRWFMVDVKFVKKFSQIITLNNLREMESLKNMPLLQKGSRLSIHPVSAKEYEVIVGGISQ